MEKKQPAITSLLWVLWAYPNFTELQLETISQVVCKET
jgi:hypothetical protein